MIAGRGGGFAARASPHRAPDQPGGHASLSQRALRRSLRVGGIGRDGEPGVAEGGRILSGQAPMVVCKGGETGAFPLTRRRWARLSQSGDQLIHLLGSRLNLVVVRKKSEPFAPLANSD